MKVVFENEGKIDVRAITTIGVSVKDSNSAIGFFGSGLKYAIAILLRNNHRITIMSGQDVYKFTTKRENIRDKEFDIVYMNDQQLGFTTELGKTWDMWMAVREIICNCLDEGGTHYEETGEVVPNNNTKVIVEGEEFYSEYKSKHKFMLDGTPIYENRFLEFHEGSTNSIFYKGIKVAEVNKPLKYTYNIKSGLVLTEDRTLKNESHFFSFDFADMLMTGTENQDILDNIVKCGDNFLEYDIYYRYTSISPTVRDMVRSYNKDYGKLIPKDLKDLCAISLDDELASEEASSMTPLQDIQLTKAIKFLKGIGMDVEQYNIKYVKDLGANRVGMADIKRGIIYVGEQAFKQGTKYLAETLMEEYVHLKHKCSDETRHMQDILLNYTISIGELYLGEPL